MPVWTGWTRTQRKWIVAFLFFLLTVVSPVTFMASHDASKLIGQGAVVEPAWRRNVVYVDHDDRQIRCTATTPSGESVALAPFTGATRKKSLGSRRGASKYWAVAVLPTDRGPLHVSCPNGGTTLWITAPEDNTWLFVFLGLMSASTVVLFVVGIRSRKGRQP